MKLSKYVVTSLSLAIFTSLAGLTAEASSHREAPNITLMPAVDSTDFYMFRSYESGREGYVTFLANYIPLQDPQGGPNYFAMDSNAVYEIHIDNNGDAIEDMTFQFRFKNTIVNDGEGQKLDIDGKMVAVPLKHIGSISVNNNAALGFNETYSVSLIDGDRRRGHKKKLTMADSGSRSFTKPYDNVGKKTFSDYSSYANSFIHEMNIPGCDVAKVFVGQRKDSFAVNLGETFDLVNYAPIDNSLGLDIGIDQDTNNDDLRNKNITTIALEVPIDCVAGESDIIGGWTSASLRKHRKLNRREKHGKFEIHRGHLTQVSRLSNPLVNELVIGLKDKDKFNSSEPKDDAQFATYVTNPTLPALLNILFKDAVNGSLDNSGLPMVPTLSPTNFPRNDLVTAFLTGVPTLNANGSVAEMLRLNTSIPATEKDGQNAFGVVVGDLAGFPNGRRPGDDVVDLALRVVMGALCHPIDLDGDGDATNDLGLCSPADANVGTVPFTDGAPISAMDFDDVFPYLRTPIAGSPN